MRPKVTESSLYLLFTAAAFSLAVLSFGCSGKGYRLVSAPSVPAATGNVHTSTDQNGNTVVDLKVNHLAPPSALTPPLNTYVVWVRPPGKQPINQGELRVDNNLQGEFKTTTPYKRFQLFITAESQAKVGAPAGQPLLRQDIGG